VVNIKGTVPYRN